MGALQSTPEQKAPELVGDFDTLLGKVTDVASLNLINGFEFTHVYQPQPSHSIVQTISISPRIHPVELAAQAGERVIPGNYSAVFVGTVSDMEYRVALPLFGSPNVQLTVPLSQYSKTSLYVDCTLNPGITGYLKYRGPKVASEFAFSASNYFTQGNIIANFSTMYKKTLFGAIIQKPLFSAGYVFRAGCATDFGKFNDGIFLSLEPKLRINKSITYSPNEDTTGGIQLDILPSELRAKSAFFINRNFAMTVFAFNVTSDATISSSLQRRFGKGYQMTLTSQADIFRKHYNFGLGLVFA